MGDEVDGQHLVLRIPLTDGESPRPGPKLVGNTVEILWTERDVDRRPRRQEPCVDIRVGRCRHLEL
ncbi:MAG: hypothetical protein ACI8TP_002547 [Acidimicrobiales bacterium]|jgi:hypothetical protein